MLQTNNRTDNRIEMQQRSYQAYAYAAETYVRKPTLENWEEKEKAFENYNALISFQRENA